MNNMIIIIIITILSICTAVYLQNNTNECLANAVTYLFPRNSTIVTINTKEIDMKNQQIITLQYPFTNASHKYDTYGKNFIIASTNDEELFQIIGDLMRSNVWNLCRSSIGNFFVACESCNEENVFLKLWTMDIISVILGNDTHYTSSSPYNTKNKCGNEYKWSVVEQCGSLANTAFFPVSKNLVHCNVSIMALTPFSEYPGMFYKNNTSYGFMIDQMRLLSTVFNFELVVYDGVDFAYEYIKNKSITKSNTLTLPAYVDTVSGMTVQVMNRVQEPFCKATKIYYEDLYYWIAPKAQEIPNVNMVYVIFPPTIWFIFLSTHAISMVMVYVLSRFLVEERFRLMLHRVVLDPIRIVMQMAFARLPRIWKLKIFIAMFLWYNLLLSTYFKSKLSSILTKPVFEKEFESLDDILERNVTIYMMETLMYTFKQQNLSATNAISRNYRLRSNFRHEIDYVKDVILYRNSSTHIFGPYLHANPMVKKNVKIAGTKHLNSVQLLYMFRASYPYRHKFDQVLSRIQSSGIPRKLMNDYVGIYWEEHVERQAVLTLQHLLSIFVILSFGYFIGAACFFIEVMYHNLCNNKQ